MSSCCSQLSYLSIYHWMSQCPSLQRPAGAPWLAAVRSAVSRSRTCLARTLSWDQRPSAAWAWLVNGTLSHCSPAQCPPLPTLPCEDLIWCLSEHNHYSDTRPICLQEQSERMIVFYSIVLGVKSSTVMQCNVCLWWSFHNNALKYTWVICTNYGQARTLVVRKENLFTSLDFD